MLAEELVSALPQDWDIRCLNYRNLKGRLIDDPADPWDDHPSLAPVQGTTGNFAFAHASTRVFASELRDALGDVSAFYKEQSCRCDVELRRLQQVAQTLNTSWIETTEAGDANDVGGAAVGVELPPWPGSADNIDNPFISTNENGVPTSTVPDSFEALAVADPHALWSLKREMIDLAVTVHLLELFRMVNHDACARLVSAHVETLSLDRRAGRILEAQLMAYIRTAPLFAESARIAGSEDKTTNTICTATSVGESLTVLYSHLFTADDISIGRAAIFHRVALRPLPARRRRRQLSVGWGGWSVGACCILLAWVVWDIIVAPPPPEGAGGVSLWRDPAFRLYRGVGNVTLCAWVWAGCVKVWRAYGVDYCRCIGLDPSNDHLAGACAVGMDLSFAFLLSFLCFAKAQRLALQNPLEVPSPFAHAFPILLLAYTTQRLLLPWGSKGKPGMLTFWRCVISPFYPAPFPYGLAGDALTSTSRVIVDLCFAFIYAFSGARSWLGSSAAAELKFDTVGSAMWWASYVAPALTLAPLWIRFQQCLRRARDDSARWPNLPNAGKYAAALLVGVWGAARSGVHSSPLWVTAFAAATFYQFFWDVMMDWDLLSYSTASIGMRSRRLFPQRWVYPAAVITNFLLRFFWTVTIIPEAPGRFLFTPAFQRTLGPFVAAVEVIRRGMWAVFRVEAEHLSLAAQDLKPVGLRDASHREAHADSNDILEQLPYSKMQQLPYSKVGGVVGDQEKRWKRKRRRSVPIPELLFYTVLLWCALTWVAWGG